MTTEVTALNLISRVNSTRADLERARRKAKAAMEAARAARDEETVATNAYNNAVHEVEYEARLLAEASLPETSHDAQEDV